MGIAAIMLEKNNLDDHCHLWLWDLLQGEGYQVVLLTRAQFSGVYLEEYAHARTSMVMPNHQ